MAISKNGKINLETSAYYQKNKDTAITFFNTDINTSVLNFYITRNNSVLPLGKPNTDVMLRLVAQDGSWIIDNVEVTDELNGICEYQLPNDFLNHTGKVTGQLYISVDKKEDTVTEVEFTFTLKDALINQVPAVDKIFYIRKYEDLELILKEKVQNIEDAYKNIDDYITKVQNASDIAVNNVNTVKNNAVKALNDKQTTSIEAVNAEGQTQLGKIDQQTAVLNNMITEFKADVDSSLFVKREETESWQKYNLTDFDGTRKIIPQLSEDIINLEPGFYTTTISKDETIARTPKVTEITGDEYRAAVNVYSDSLNQKQIFITNMQTGTMYSKYIQDVGTEIGWNKVAQLFESDELMTQAVMNKALTQNNDTLKTLMSQTYKPKDKKIFSGDARTRDSSFTLSDPYTNFSYILIKYRQPGGAKMLPFFIDTDKLIQIQDSNLTDSTGDTPNLYEIGIKFLSPTVFSVTHNNSYNVKTQTPTYDGNYLVIKEIVGVY